MNQMITMRNNKKWLYVGVSILLMIIYGTVYSWGVFRLPVESHYQVGATLSGLPYMTFLLVYAISMLIGGKLIKKYPPIKLLRIGGILIFAGWILSAFTNHIGLLTLTYGGVIGFGVGISYGVPIYIMAKWFPKRKGFVIGLVLSGFGLSPLLTAPIGQWLINHNGVKETFLYYGIVFGMLIMLLAQFIKLPEMDQESTHGKTKLLNQKNEMIQKKSFKFTYTCFFIGTLIGLTIIGLTSNIARDLIGLDLRTTALMMSVFAVFNGVGRPLFGWMTEKYGPVFSMRLSYLLIGIGATGMLFAKEGSVLLYVILFTVLWLNLGAWLAIAPMMTMKLYGMEAYSENYGIMFTAYGFGAVVGVLGTGMLIDLLNDYRLIFLGIAGVSLIGYFLARRITLEGVKEDGELLEQGVI